MENWMVACAAGALLARAGLALYTCGLVRAKNAGGALLRHVGDFCLTALTFWAVGIAILDPGGNASVLNWHALFGLRGDDAALFGGHVFLMLCVTLLASGIVVGSLSERSRFWPSFAPSVLLGGVLVPLFARWAGASGWLGRMGFHDGAGASYVHVAAGTCAAAGAIIVGGRTGKYNRDGSSNVIPGHSLPLAGGGAALIVVAWLPYVLAFSGASMLTAGMIGMNVVLAAASGGMAALIVGQLRYGKPDITLTLTGVLGALVAITAGADVMSNLFAAITGAVAGVVVPWFVLQIDLVWKADDPTGAVATHAVGGAWGLIATGLFGPAASWSEKLKSLGTQTLGLLVVALLAGGLSVVVFVAMSRLVRLRAREADEFDGLDLAEHDIGSYPDFQQTTIKSYHLREA